jgi:ABC-type branched-subunit amino acid transport system substrate-binding protein
MRRRVVALVMSLALVAAACGNRSGDGDSGAPDGGGDDGGGDEFTTDVGVTDDEIRIGVIADLGGVVPGLFKAAVDAVEAYAAKVNSEDGINGRKLVVEVFDTKTTEAGNADAYEEACPRVFASVGSESAMDSGGIDAQTDCGFPDLSGFKTDPEVQALPNVFPRSSPDYTGVGAARWFAEEFPDAVKNAAIFHGTPQVTVRAAENLIEAREAVGWRFTYRQPTAPIESNYEPYALEMRSRGIKAFAIVHEVNSIVRLQSSLHEVKYDVDVADVNTQGYTPDYLDAVGPAGDGSYVPLAHALFEEADQVPALAEYFEWLEKVAPGAEPSSNGLTAWVRAKLFVEAAEAVGEDLTREKLVAELEGITDWDADGLVPPDDVGEPVPKTSCFVMAQVQGGKYVRVFPESGFHCSPDDVYTYKAAG